MTTTKSVLITGASTGIGKASALALAAAGFRVFAGVRKPSDGEALIVASRGGVEPVLIDVVDRASIARAAQRIEHVLGGAGLDGLVNNAGISVSGPLEFLPLDMFEQQLRVNVTGQLAVTQAFLPLLRKARGRIVFMSSVSGRVSMPLVGAYAASKFALEAVADALRSELYDTGIRVALIEPGSIKTPIWEKAVEHSNVLDAAAPESKALYGRELSLLRVLPQKAAALAAEPAVVARAVVHALSARRPKLRYLVGPEAMWLVLFFWIAPTRVADYIVARVLRLLSRRLVSQ